MKARDLFKHVYDLLVGTRFKGLNEGIALNYA